MNDILKQHCSIKCLGVVINFNLNWKAQAAQLSKKIKHNVGVISKISNFVNRDIFIRLYYSLVYPFLTYVLIIWGNTYHSSINPLFIPQRKGYSFDHFFTLL